MKNTQTREQQDAVALKRRRYLDARKRGMAQDSAIAFSNGREPAAPVIAAPIPVAEDDAKAALPANWRNLPWPALKSLAAKNSETPIRNRADAMDALAAVDGIS